jgi:hypothetical protein
MKTINSHSKLSITKMTVTTFSLLKNLEGKFDVTLNTVRTGF